MSVLVKKISMVKRWFLIITQKSVTAVKQGEGTEYSIHEIKGYYNDLTGKVCSSTLLDDKGIPLTQIDSGEKVYFPIVIFQYGLGCFDLYLKTKAVSYFKMFSRVVQWALQNQQEDGSWNCFGPLHSNLYTVSSMGQGEGASVFCRAYVYLKEEVYLEAAKKAINFMLLSMENGGTAVREGGLFLEEYPQSDRRSVLNGWIFSIFGLFDLSLLDSGYRKDFELTCETLRLHLHEYDGGYWSYYDNQRKIASPAYHNVHITLLNVLNQLYPCTEYEEYSIKFQNYQKNYIYKAKAIFLKIIQKFFEKPDCIVIQ